MTTARQLLQPARDAGRADHAAAGDLARWAEWSAIYDAIDAAVLGELDALEAADAVDEARGLVGGDGDDNTDTRLTGHRLGALSERCVEAVTFDDLFARPVADLVTLWRAVCRVAQRPGVASALWGDDPASGITPDAVAALESDDRPLDEARFEAPVDAMWQPVERLVIAGVDANLEHRFGHAVEY